MAGLASKTYDPTIRAPFELGIADSSRATCRNPDCPYPKRKITKGSIRIARMERSPNPEKRGRIVPKWVHLECCAPVILQEAVDRYDGIENVIGFDRLEPDQQSEVVEISIRILAITSAAGGGGGGGGGGGAAAAAALANNNYNNNEVATSTNIENTAPKKKRSGGRAKKKKQKNKGKQHDQGKTQGDPIILIDD